MKKLEIYSDGFNAQKAQLISLYADNALTLTHRIYTQPSLDELITPHVTFSFVKTGIKRMFVNGIEFLLSAGDLLYIPKNAAVFSYLEPGASGFESISLTIDLTAFNESVILPHKPVCLQNAVARTTFERLVMSNNPGTMLSSLFQLFQGDNDTVRSSKVSSTQDHLVQIIAAGLYTQDTLPQLAADCHMSLSTFKRHFEAHFGMSPKDWIIRRRLETAYFEMLVMHTTVSDACYQCGFENLPHFSYSFKKHFGFSPSAINRQSRLN